MTAPTPDLESRLRTLSVRATEGGMYEANETLLVGDMAAALIEAADALAAVTAERDQARQMLADAEKKIASMELDESLREEDERFADPL